MHGHVGQQGEDKMTKHAAEFRVTWPDWVPENVRRYLCHTNDSDSIRSVARQDESCASTVLRQVRHVEASREDGLMDDGLAWLIDLYDRSRARTGPSADPAVLPHDTQRDQELEAVTREIAPALRRLAQPGAVLAIADGMDRAVIVRDREDGEAHRLGVVERSVAYALAVNEWIETITTGRISRHRISAAGRSRLNEIIARAENRANGFSDAGGISAGKPSGRVIRRRTGLAETPALALSRRRDPSGEPFLAPDLVRAAERIQDDFELAQMEPRSTQNWDQFLTAGVTGSKVPDPTLRGASAARDRVTAALRALGPGLGDVVLECCCRLQGLEAAERNLGWSARSGKIVLRIALQRLSAYYAGLRDGGGLIG